MKKKKDIYYFIAHLDDFEISCLAHLGKFHHKYNQINIFIACKWHKKQEIWLENLSLIEDFFDIKVNYHNFSFDQRTLMSNIDNDFDLVSHDKEDNHTDHFSCSLIARGMYKYSSTFVSIYSPSSTNFKANCWISMSVPLFALKKQCVDKYSIKNEQSYSKLGYYMQSDNHYNVGKVFYIENFANHYNEYYEVYNFQKQVY